MKIYKNEKGQIVVDGDGITTIEVPQNIRGAIGVNEWLKSRLGFSKDKNGKYIITGFVFKWPEISDPELSRFKNVTEIDV
jgi:hypothetical protein